LFLNGKTYLLNKNQLPPFSAGAFFWADFLRLLFLAAAVVATAAVVVIIAEKKDDDDNNDKPCVIAEEVHCSASFRRYIYASYNLIL